MNQKIKTIGILLFMNAVLLCLVSACSKSEYQDFGPLPLDDQTAEVQTPGTQASEPQSSGDQTAEVQTPGTQASEPQSSGDQATEAQPPESQAPEAPSSDAQTSEPQASAPQLSLPQWDLAAELADAETEALSLSQSLLDFDEVQMEEASQTLYELWDGKLNEYYNRLKEALSPETFQNLQASEQEWIAFKEAETAAASSRYEDSYLINVILLQRQAALTRARVYELAETLGAQFGQSVPLPPQDAYAGLYADTMGTADLYSELALVPQGDGTYRAEIGIYRLSTFTGTTKPDNGALLFESPENPYLTGTITVSEEGATFTVTDTDFSYLNPDDNFLFSEKIY